MKLKILVLIMGALVLSSCSPKATATALPTVVLSSPSGTASPILSTSRGNVAASGTIVPEQEAQMAFTLGGSLKIVNVAVGDQIKAGQILAELDSAAIQLEIDQAQSSVNELTSPAAQAAAEQALAVAQQNLKDQQDKVNSQFYRRASDTLIDKTQGEIDLAKDSLARASDSYRTVARLEDGDNRKAAALVAMSNAQLRLNELIAKYNWYAGKPSEIDAALANAKLDVAKAAVQEAEWYLAVLKGENVSSNATGANLARLQSARTVLATAQDRLDHTRLISPIPGVVVKITGIAGETVSPGELLFFISDVTHLRVETTDLSERDVPSVTVGQKVLISVKALNKNIPGHVTSISPVADTLGGDVVYQTKIEFDTDTDGLLAGMSVDVQYETGN
ncbi:MAG: efflux RND transporter periplasmic adaptor subunit [Chloroflexi bacterium]|nr:efflux RND transporter periplasmic adaptor subunit [Chloroflexota bacterium]